MTSPHLTLEDAGRWVSGLLEGAEAAGLEAHVVGCESCTSLLQREARAELLLRDASRPEKVRGAPRRWRRALPLAAAAAALVVLGVVARVAGSRAEQPTSDVAPPPPPVFEVQRYEGAAPRPVLAAPAPL
jgi:anti-sigma factor RsiW